MFHGRNLIPRLVPVIANLVRDQEIDRRKTKIAKDRQPYPKDTFVAIVKGDEDALDPEIATGHRFLKLSQTQRRITTIRQPSQVRSKQLRRCRKGALRISKVVIYKDDERPLLLSDNQAIASKGTV
jgi:hypothetical protein